MGPQPDAQSLGASRPSGLPRPSKLPLPRSSIPNLRQSSTDKPTNGASIKPRTFASSTSKPRPPLLSTQTNTRPPSHLRDATVRSPSDHEGSFKRPSTRPLSRANLQAQAKDRQVSVSSSKASQNDDEVGSLHSFRSDATYSTNATSPTDAPMTPTLRGSSRPSLSERTIESLQSIPPSPASMRRRSSFFSPGGAMAPRSRPASALGGSSQSIAQSGPLEVSKGRAPKTLNAKPSLPSMNASIRATPSQHTLFSAASSTVRARSPTKASMLKAVERENGTPVMMKASLRTPARSSKTLSGRVQAPRGSVTDLFGAEGSRSAAATSRPALRSTPKPAAKKTLATTEDSKPSPKATQAAKSSAALREQIRAARAARLSTSKQGHHESLADFGPSMIKDPFNTGVAELRSPMRQRIDAARAEGRLNLSAMQLKDIPEDVMRMYDYDFNKDSSIQWNEVVDLTRFIAADNEIETIPDTIFPDVSGNDEDEEEDFKFGGLEVLDLHGNVLFDVPRGLRRLECLTSLNLSRNRLMNDALETIAQIISLRELKIADNLLTGELTFIEQLTNLEVLDVQDNRLSILPDEIRGLIRLRSLNVSNNQLTELPILELAKLPLVDLFASKNKIAGTLFTTAGITMNRLQTMDISVNQLTALYGGSAGPEFPALRSLNVSFNMVTALPDISSWSSLTTLLAQDNKISQLPPGFVESTSIRSADFTGNDLNRLDERIALMDNLESFEIAANPLRERKFLTMTTDELKEELTARLGPAAFLS